MREIKINWFLVFVGIIIVIQIYGMINHLGAYK